MANRTITIVGPDNCPVTIHTVTAKMNERHAYLKRVNPLGFLDQFESQLEIFCADLAAENKGEFMLRDGRDSEGKPCDDLLFAFGVSIDEADRVTQGN